MPESSSYCIAAGTVGITLDNPTPGEIAAALAEVNAEALAGAQLAAEDLLVTITNADPVDTNWGSPFSFQLTASGGFGPYTFSLVSGDLPDGLTFVNGLISGTPTAPVESYPDKDVHSENYYPFEPLGPTSNPYVYRIQVRAVGDTDDACYKWFALRFFYP